MTTHGIAKLWKPVVNVTNLDEGERFWSALSGMTPTGRHGDANGHTYAVLEDPDGEEDDLWILLQLVTDAGGSRKGGTHLDFRVGDVAEAVQRTTLIGGKTVKTPAFYPSEAEAYLEWAIMEDPFGNEFCFVRWPLEERT